MVAPLHTNLAAALAQLDARQFDVVAACERSLAIDQDFVKARVRRAGALSALPVARRRSTAPPARSRPPPAPHGSSSSRSSRA